MRRLLFLTRTSLLVLCFVAAASAGPGDYIVTLKPGAAMPTGAPQLKGWTKAALGNNTFLVQIPPSPVGSAVLSLLKTSSQVVSVGQDLPAVLPESSGHKAKDRFTFPISTPTCATPANVSTGKLPPPTYYQAQPAVCLVSLPAVQQKTIGLAGTKMALIDTWVDVWHKAFGGTIDLVNSMSFADPSQPVLLTQETSPMVDQETSPMVDQETSPMVDGSGAIILNQETSPMVDQETSPMVDSKNPAYAGHGTGVAGIMHLVAPGASIVALEAFSANDGSGNISSIVAAINYAVNTAHVNVINMSFTVPAALAAPDSPLTSAINNALAQGVVIVGSVPDTGGSVSAPANYPGVTSVACTDNTDQICTFSGTVPGVTIYAPGYQVMSLYPGNRYALYTGTSFSAPWATGAGALMMPALLKDSLGSQSATAQTAIQNGDLITVGQVQVDRLDINKAVSK
jgi:hypothetical protein